MEIIRFHLFASSLRILGGFLLLFYKVYSEFLSWFLVIFGILVMVLGYLDMWLDALLLGVEGERVDHMW